MKLTLILQDCMRVVNVATVGKSNKVTCEYSMPLRVLSRLQKSRGSKDIICHGPNCDKPIKPRDLVVSTRFNGHVKIWHKDCYEKSFY